MDYFLLFLYVGHYGIVAFNAYWVGIALNKKQLTRATIHGTLTAFSIWTYSHLPDLF